MQLCLSYLLQQRVNQNVLPIFCHFETDLQSLILGKHHQFSKIRQISFTIQLNSLMKNLAIFVIVALLLTVSQATTSPISALGTTLPPLSTSLNYRVFNDLMKQSLQFVPYQFIWGGVGRYWGYNLTYINGLAHQYPASLATNVYAAAQITFYPEDVALLNKTFSLKFQGSGVVGVYQQGLYNLTWSSSTGGSFVLKAINQSLFVYIYRTSTANPVNTITIFPTSLGASPSTFTSNFLNYISPFNLLRTCFWQGQNIYNSGVSSQIWNNRTLPSSSSQITSSGVALEHILQLQKLGITIWPCIPDTADSNYITQMGTLLATTRVQSNILYLQFGNVYTIMNDFPDRISNPAFDTFMQAYGRNYRANVLCTINYKDIQYYINAVGMRTTPVNFTYIDAIGAEAAFGIIDATQGYGLNDTGLKRLIVNMELTYETTLNTAYQLATMNGTSLIMFSGGPYLRVPQYAWNFFYSKNTSNLTLQTLASQETSLYNTLTQMNINDPWVQDLALHWIARLKSMGVKTFMFSQLVGSFTMNSNIVPLLPNLNASSSQIYAALQQYVIHNKTTALPTSGTVPPNPFTCSPSCKWGDCTGNNVCSCYAAYSGSDCSIYTAPGLQNKIGMNLQGVSYWTTQHPFIDMHREGSDWVYFQANKPGWNLGLPYKNQVPLDENGYPTYLPPGISIGTLIARDVQTHYDNGTYVVLYDGDGILTFGMFDLIATRYGIGRVEIDIQPSTNMNNGILVVISRTNPNNYIRNIRVIRPGFEGIWQAVNFSPLLLEKLQPFGTLRFMDWTNTNGQIDVAWANRTKTTYRTYTINGVAWEQTIRICNTLGKHAWINIPHLATDDYIRQLAQLFYSKLEPHLNVYVEYSNQVWGTLFPGGQYAQNQGVSMNLSPGDPTEARFCYLGLRTNQISVIWRGVYGNDPRLNIIVSTQAVNADTTKRILACQSTYNYVNGVAIAPYLDITLTDTMSYKSIIDALTAKVPSIGTMIKSHLPYTNNHSLPLMCYESGQGLVGNTATQTNLQTGVQTFPLMRQVYLSYLQMLFNSSITLANHYCDSSAFSKYGSWGLFQYIDEPLSNSQKWLGTNDYFIEQTLSTGIQGYGNCVKNCSGNGLCSFGMCLCYSTHTGSDCSIGKFVDYVDCGYLCTFNQGVCGFNKLVGNSRYYNCTCNAGWTGAYCSIAICSSNCSYNGLCTAPNTCSCFRGRMGTNCQLDCGCGGHGTCASDQTCICDAGFNYNSTSKKCQNACFGQPSSSCYAPNLLACSSGCIGGTCTNGSCNCWPGFTGSNCTTETYVNYINANLGINLAGLSYWSTQHLLKDYFKQSSTWVPLYYPNYFNSSIQYTWNTNQSYVSLANGYPAFLYTNMSLAKLLLRDIKGYYPSINTTNKYVLLYDGEGTIQLGMDATQTQYSAGRIKFTVSPSAVLNNGVYVNLILTNPNNPIQNIRVVLERDQYNFNQDLLTQNFMVFIQQFSTIRFMDLMDTNGSPVSEWNQTTLPNQDTQALPSGISIDLLAKIIKRTGRNGWLNIPHLASDDYVTQLANYLKNNIPQNRIIYVEYSNQVWNTFFAQGKYAVERAAALNLTNYHKFYALRSIQIFNIFSSVFGANSPRLKYVISYQAVSSWVADQIFSFSTTINSISISLTSFPNLIIAAAPYYDCNNIGSSANTSIVATQTVAQVIQTCTNQFGSLTNILQIQTNISLKYGNIPMATYEAGTSISEQGTIYSGAETPSATATFIAANRDPGMYNVYKTLLLTYKQNNLAATAPLNIFSSIGLPSKYGSWGVLDYMDQVNQNPTHPKFQAILDFNQGK